MTCPVSLAGHRECACFTAAQSMTLNYNEIDLIQRFTQGDALFVCGNRRIPIHVLATDKELAEMGMRKD